MNDSKTIINMIKNRRIELNMSQRELAKLTGINNSTLSRYENFEREFPINDLSKFAKALNLDVNYLLGITDKVTLIGKVDIMNTYKYIPSPVAAGRPENIDGQNFQEISIPSKLLGKYAGNSNIIIMKVYGDSMNKIIPNDSLVAILPFQSSLDIKDGDIVVFNDSSYDYSVKRYYKVDNKIIFKPESTSPVFTDIIYDLESETVDIIGKVIMYTVVI